MNRGELWTAAGGGQYAGKPRPVLIIQSDLIIFDGSVIVIPTTTVEPSEETRFRVFLPSRVTGLRQDCYLMVDKIQALKKTNLGKRVGQVPPGILKDLRSTILVLLGFLDGN